MLMFCSNAHTHIHTHTQEIALEIALEKYVVEKCENEPKLSYKYLNVKIKCKKTIIR